MHSDTKAANALPTHIDSVNQHLLQTCRFFIRFFQYSDLNAFTKYRADKDVARYQSWSTYTFQDALDLFNKMDYSSFGQIGSWYQLAIEDRKSHQLVGDLALHFVDHEKMEIGYTIAAKNHRTGIAFEAISALLDYLFLTLNKQKIVAFVDKRNIASYRLLEKAGFKRVADLQANSSVLTGWGDEYLYMKLRSAHLQ
ncbi:GNAT family protein [Vibrio sp. TH_r3]|uniref:GNAT family N-acetyltransferase n=1 Tax=Vibrio sp. TH_r3 TaxID=3082084 RepID=UPI0029548D19|nr:GNAT family protein [Vibrio sp. TH_r3]MDV7103308.1 GNAT family protein [Vibrio sp. TH_r3]